MLATCQFLPHEHLETFKRGCLRDGKTFWKIASDNNTSNFPIFFQKITETLSVGGSKIIFGFCVGWKKGFKTWKFLKFQMLLAAEQM